MKKAVSLLLALALSLGLTIPALADQSTTTLNTAYKDLDPRTEIYAVTQTPGPDYPYYGAKNEPNGGVYYGRTCQGGTLPDGRYGLINQSHMVGAIYNLEKFDDEISRTNQELAELTAKKQEALNTFDTVTQTIISDEIIRSSKDKIDQLTQSHERMEERLKDLGQQVQEKSLELTEKYEIYVGKEFMQPEKLAELARLIRSGEAANITEAISLYKIGK